MTQDQHFNVAGYILLNPQETFPIPIKCSKNTANQQTDKSMPLWREWPPAD